MTDKVRPSVRVTPRRTALAVTVAAVLVIAAGAAAEWLSYLGYHAKGLLPEFHLNGENNLPTWFSTLILFVCSLLLGLIADVKRRAGEAYRTHWAVLALIFAYLSLDEMASLHELLNEPLRQWFGGETVLFWPWVIPFALLTLVFALLYLRFLLNLPRVTRWLFTAAGIVYAGSALGFELLESWSFTRYGSYEHPTMRLFVVVEESLEILGICLFVYALLDYLGRRYGSLRIDFSARADLPPLPRRR
jgi:hypothetical protein